MWPLAARLREGLRRDPSPSSTHSTLAWGPAPVDADAEPRGRVVDASTGAALREAYVSIEPGRHALLTDSLGEFRILGLAHGVYQIRVRRMRYVDARGSVKYGMGGLRPFAALAPQMGIIDFICKVPVH